MSFSRIEPEELYRQVGGRNPVGEDREATRSAVPLDTVFEAGAGSASEAETDIVQRDGVFRFEDESEGQAAWLLSLWTNDSRDRSAVSRSAGSSAQVKSLMSEMATPRWESSPRAEKMLAKTRSS